MSIWWRPAPLEWSTGECLLHLTLVDGAYLEALGKAIERGRAGGQLGRGPFRHGSLGGWFTKLMEPPPRWKLPARLGFRPELPVDASPEELPDPLTLFLELREPLIGMLRRADGLDLAGIRTQCPASLLLRFTLGEALAIMTAHERRHLWQAEQVRADPEFPG